MAEMLRKILKWMEAAESIEDEQLQTIVVKHAKRLKDDLDKIRNRGQEDDFNIIEKLNEITLCCKRIKPLNSKELREDLHLMIADLTDEFLKITEAEVIGANTNNYVIETLENMFNFDGEVDMEFIQSRWQKFITSLKKIKQLKIKEAELCN